MLRGQIRHNESGRNGLKESRWNEGEVDPLLCQRAMQGADYGTLSKLNRYAASKLVQLGLDRATLRQ